MPYNLGSVIQRQIPQRTIDPKTGRSTPFSQWSGQDAPTGSNFYTRPLAAVGGILTGGEFLASLFGGSSAAGEAGGGGAGGSAGTGALEGSGTAPGGASGPVSDSGSPSIMDYIRYGQQGSKLMNNVGGQTQQPSGMNGVRGDMGTSIWSSINIPQAGGRRSIDDISRKGPPTALTSAENLASKGRYGDTNLLHVSDDELNQLNSTGKLTQNPNTGLPEAFSLGGMFSGGGGGFPGLGNIFGGVLGGAQGNQAGGAIQNATNRGVSIGAPLENPQRQPYQQQLAGMFNDPSNFLATDPYIQASKKALGDQYQANFAKSGNLPFSSITGSAALQQMFGQAFNDRIRQLTTLGGFDQGPGYGGNIAYQGGKDAATIRNNAQTGGLNQIFGGLGGMMGGSGSGMGGLFSGFQNLFGGQGGGGNIAQNLTNVDYTGIE